MIIYSPVDGDAFTKSVPSNPRHCFLMTPLGEEVPRSIQDIRERVTTLCREMNYEVIDAASRVTGRDFLLKIWTLIASSPLAIGIYHEDIRNDTVGNISYEMGIAQAMGKETLVIKSPNLKKLPSDFVRSEYITFDENFEKNFRKFLTEIFAQADHYEMMADQLDRNPILAMDYLKRAFLITGDGRLRTRANQILEEASLADRAANSVELIAAQF